jgi:peptide/nickel transport system substrate-binding protein
VFRRSRTARLTTLMIAAAAAVAGCASASTPQPAAATTVTYGLPPHVEFSYIWPYMSLAKSTVYNAQQFQWLMYRPLYLFGANSGTSVAVNYPLSPAEEPVYSDGGTTVTITMKGWKWSNGESVDASDVIFWLHMMQAEKTGFYGYAPGLLPDNMTSVTSAGPDTVIMHLNHAYSSVWFTDNQLAEITPMPMAWDISSAGAAPGSGGCTTDSAADRWARCAAVYDFLDTQASDPGAYPTSPTWSIVDGPFKLSAFDSSGSVTLVPNPSYSGSPQPAISALHYVPFGSDAAMFGALKAGTVDVAVVPPADLPRRGAPGQAVGGYNLVPFYSFGVSYIQPNFNGPARDLMRQLYVRQALQELVDQPGMVSSVWHGYAVPTAGPVPAAPASQWQPSAESANDGQGSYPFSIQNARSLLTSHGWQEVGGVMTCENPSLCGTRGTQLTFTVDYSAKPAELAREMATYQQDARQIGVRITLVAQSFGTVVAESHPCSPGPACRWDALMYGGWVFNGPGFEPTGEALFQTGAAANSGSYSDPREDTLIGLTHTSGNINDFYQYAQYTMQQAPYIWMPDYYYVMAVTSKLQGVTFSPIYTILPEYWHFTS